MSEPITKKSFYSTDPQSHKGKTDTWLTPLSFIRELGDFDLDPCAFPGHKTAKTLWTENGDTRKWKGRVWLNPPYSEAGRWLDMLAEHGFGTALVFNRCDTKVFQRHLRIASSVFFLEGRIQFLKPDFSKGHNAGTGSMLLSYGPMIDYGNLKGWVAK